MKTKLLKLSCFALLLFTFFGCGENAQLKKQLEIAKSEIKTLKSEIESPEITNFFSCRDDTSRYKPGIGTNLNLKFNCEDNRYQPVHLDLKVGFAILGKVELNKNNTLKYFYLKLQEVGSCKRYKITKAVYNPQIDENGKTIHKINLTLDSGISNGKYIKVDFNSEIFKVKASELIDIHILDEKGNINWINDAMVTRIGEQFCITEITQP